MAALYLHIPFCSSKCHYCSFNSFVARRSLYAPYVAALKAELSLLAEKEQELRLATVFIGGGTPTCLSPTLLAELLACCFNRFTVEKGAEISIEANPGTVNEGFLARLLESGVNRLSLGVQSFDDNELSCLGRRHSGEEACGAVEAARSAGFTNINLDLMYGLPDQSADAWQRSLRMGLSLHPSHLSLYQLTIEPDTPFGDRVEKGELTLPSEEEILLMDAVTVDLCRKAQFHRYEISNYSLAGYRCRHNINYWNNLEYYAVGASAVSYRRGVRQRRVADPAEYIRLSLAGRSVISEREELSLEESLRETVIMGLRMDEGVSREALYARYGIALEQYYGATLQDLILDGLVELTDSHLRISKKGYPFSNRIMAELV